MDQYPPPHLPRKMSYRKPAPVFIPSPPSSPADSSPPPLSAAEETMPPLPTDWREVISQAMMSNVAGEDATLGDSTAEVEDNRVAGDQPVAQTLREADRNGSVSPPPQCPGSPMSPGRGRKRKFHQSYRPPTPPLPAVNKEQLPLDDEIELPKPGNPTFFTGSASPQPYLSGPGVSKANHLSLSTHASFMTVNTQQSYGVSTSGSSTVYYDMQGSEHTNVHDLPILPMHILPPRRGSTKSESWFSSKSSWLGGKESLGEFFRARLRGFKSMVCLRQSD